MVVKDVNCVDKAIHLPVSLFCGKLLMRGHSYFLELLNKSIMFCGIKKFSEVSKIW